MPFLFLCESDIGLSNQLQNLLSTGSRGSSKICSQQPAYMHPPVQLNPAHSTEKSKLRTLHPNPRPQKPTTTPGDRISRPPQRRRPLSPEPQSLCCCCCSSSFLFLFLPQRLPTWPCDLSPRHSIISVHRGPNPKLQTADPLENVRARREMHADRRALARSLGRSISAGAEGGRARAAWGARARGA
jgi:hypothetical protein